MVELKPGCICFSNSINAPLLSKLKLSSHQHWKEMCSQVNHPRPSLRKENHQVGQSANTPLPGKIGTSASQVHRMSIPLRAGHGRCNVRLGEGQVRGLGKQATEELPELTEDTWEWQGQGLPQRTLDCR